MFKFMFRTITLILFLIVLVIGLSIWKGGTPFRDVGKGLESIGRAFSEFGDFVDDVKRGSNNVTHTYDQLKDTITDSDLNPVSKDE